MQVFVVYVFVYYAKPFYGYRDDALQMMTHNDE